jgi:hypothetical protein
MQGHGQRDGLSVVHHHLNRLQQMDSTLPMNIFMDK